ncbi:MAG TPA: hypothetical protein VJ697_00680, partial [Nitrososphaeraceae archaeon]|nr:hypothetical protein [Nitrososphaeraceae archaeon]
FLHDQYGYDLQQNIINTNGPTGTTGQLNTLNQGKQILNAKVFNDADVGYDTYGLSTLSQKIQDISGIGTIQNLAGNNNNPGSPINPTSPVLATDTDGMRVNLEASGFGSNVDADNTLQNLDQQIVGFTGSTTSASATNTVNSMLFSALARQVQSNDIADITNTENEPQTQTVNQYIGNSGGNVDLDNIATARINLGFEAFNANPTAGDIPIRGDLKYEDLSQTLNQAITNVNSPTTAKTAFNQGQTLITLLSSNGPSQFIVDGFNQYLDQTVDGCTNCGNIGTVQAIFSVNDAATFTLEEGSIQGLTQYVNQDNVFNNNQVLATIGVTGDGTDASILYQQEVSSINGDNSGPTNNNGISQFSANINSDAQLHCSITDTGNYFAAGYPTSAPTPRSNACT